MAAKAALEVLYLTSRRRCYVAIIVTSSADFVKEKIKRPVYWYGRENSSGLILRRVRNIIDAAYP